MGKIVSFLFRILLLPAFCAAMNGCYVADALFIPPAEEPTPTLQERTEKAITEYITQRKEHSLYRPYGFSPVTIHKPLEIHELEQLEASRESGQQTGPEIDSLIAQKRRYIDQHRIERTVETSHFFTLSSGIDQLVVCEINYVLNDTLQVIDFSPKIMLELPADYQDALMTYFYEYTIFVSDSYTESRQLSNRFYTFFKSRQASFTDVAAKSAFLYHALKITRQVKKAGAFDPQKITEYLVTERFTTSTDSIPGYASRAFSPLYEKSAGDQVMGYYIFNKFIGRLNDTLDLFVNRIDFSPYYEIESVTQMDEPFESYLNN